MEIGTSLMLYAFLLPLCINGLPYQPNAKYEGWQVMHVKVEGDSSKIIEDLYDLEEPSTMQVIRLDNRIDYGVIEIAVSPNSMNDIADKLSAVGASYTTVLDDLSLLLRQSEPVLRDTQLAQGAVTFDRYMNFNEIARHLKNLPNQFPGKVKVEVIGRTHENRAIYQVTIYTGSAKNPPVIFVDGGIHAREWISPASTLFTINRLLETPSLTDEVEWRIIPVLNPDGYIYTWTNDRMWRKNRGPTRSPTCTGVDLNRNFDYHWGESGSSNKPCSSVFKGPESNSEPETKALINALLRIKERTKAYVTIHSYGQLILYPFVHDGSEASNQKELDEVGQGMLDEITKEGGNKFTVGNGGKILYTAAGISSDWALGVAGVPLSYTFELRPKAGVGFILPSRQIKAGVNEAWSALRYLGQHVITQEKIKQQESSPDHLVEAVIFPTRHAAAPSPSMLQENIPSQDIFLEGFKNKASGEGEEEGEEDEEKEEEEKEEEE